MHSLKNQVCELLSGAGITLNGSNQWDIQVHNNEFYARVFREGSLGLGEAYMDKWWDCEALDEFIARLLRARLQNTVKLPLRTILNAAWARVGNLQSRKHAFKIAQHHYDIGNDLYERMLDSSMTYTCAYWKDASNLDSAQEAKLDLVCRKIGLKAGQKVLDIGCGWGSFAMHAAHNYSANVVGITVSKNQVELARARCAGLPIEIRLQDYRDLNETFDHVISLGMFEHVGYKNYRSFMKVVKRSLKPGGLFLLHTIGGNHSATSTDPWIGKYIFPNSMLPSVQQIAKACERLFVLEDWHSFGHYYEKTLLAWYTNFEKHWSELAPKYGERFFRMWRYYLLACAGSFQVRYNQLWQIVYSPNGVFDGYESVR